jgi:Crinkler effector protein N-terminal domain
MPYTILCILIDGTTPFPVTIDETRSVGELKAIKKKKEPELDAFAADALTLYKVDIDGSDRATMRSASKKCRTYPRNWASPFSPLLSLPLTTHLL